MGMAPVNDSLRYDTWASWAYTSNTASTYRDMGYQAARLVREIQTFTDILRRTMARAALCRIDSPREHDEDELPAAAQWAPREYVRRMGRRRYRGGRGARRLRKRAPLGAL